jgi:aspartate kinase
MLVFKFGGASVKSSGGILNLAHILESYHADNIAIVISAFGKTTNAIEKILELAIKSKPFDAEFTALKEYHFGILSELFTSEKHPAHKDIHEVFNELYANLSRKEKGSYDMEYDQTVSFGEILSTKIVSAYLNERGITNKWVDVRRHFRTDSNFREGIIDWETTTRLVKETFTFKNQRIYITQGFIGGDENGHTTTLGREGSDYSAAILAYILDAEKVVIWKDVPGVLNADPKYFDNTVRLGHLSYLDAIELTYYGASVIHPKTIKPLQNKKIQLHVKSFVYPNDPGTIVCDVQYESLIPSFIFKIDQVLMGISPKDFSFIAEANLKDIFTIFSKHGIKINLMQNSAISFKVCIDNKPDRINQIVSDLSHLFNISIENGLELITIRYFDTQTIDRVMVNKELVLEQKNNTTIQIVVKPMEK